MWSENHQIFNKHSDSFLDKVLLMYTVWAQGSPLSPRQLLFCMNLFPNLAFHFPDFIWDVFNVVHKKFIIQNPPPPKKKQKEKKEKKNVWLGA